MVKISESLSAIGISFPSPPGAKANYVPWLISGKHLYISGQVSRDEAGRYTGKVGRELDIETGTLAARFCGLSLISQIAAALDDDLDRLERIVKVNAFVQVAEGFTSIPQIVNGCSDLMVEAFGSRGRHTRSSVGVFQLPSNCAVEIDAVVEIRP
jgi:enamine deaminase RidA (YjgF/YER057c/UK114 family)